MDSFEWLRPAVEKTLARVRGLGAQVIRAEIGAPAKEAQLQKVEKRLGLALPPELRALFRSFAATCELQWFLDLPKPESGIAPFGGSLGGHVSMSLRETSIVSHFDYWWAEDIVAGRASGEWLKKLSLHSARDGDFLAYGLEGRIANKPVFVPHDATRSRYLVLGDSLQDFLRTWARTGFMEIHAFWQFQDDSIERLPSWDAFAKEMEFLNL